MDHHGETGKMIKVLVFCFNQEKIVDLCHHEDLQTVTVLQLKEKIKEKFQWSSNSWRKVKLFCSGKLLDEDSKWLCEYGVGHMSVIHVVIGLPGGAGPDWMRYLEMADKEGETRKSMENIHLRTF
uniref:Ubiquitin-like domain-containing protein n=1 Tax=Nothobranchius korthausae TaxID=1143690 RepID=A0A1A8FDB6_9TELE